MILVAGLPYSGTTMLVDVLEAMGVNMYNEHYVDANTGEDRFMAHATDTQLAEEAIKRNKLYGSMWGWKDPYAYRKRATGGEKNIVIFRDPIAMTRKQTFRDLELSVLDLERAYKWGMQNNALMLSYERALIDPKDMIRRVARLVGAELSDERVDEIASLIEPEKGHRNERA